MRGKLLFSYRVMNVHGSSVKPISNDHDQISGNLFLIPALCVCLPPLFSMCDYFLIIVLSHLPCSFHGTMANPPVWLPHMFWWYADNTWVTFSPWRKATKGRPHTFTPSILSIILSVLCFWSSLHGISLGKTWGRYHHFLVKCVCQSGFSISVSF